MIIGVWSPFGGSGTSVTSLSLGLKVSLVKSDKIALFQTALKYNDLIDYATPTPDILTTTATDGVSKLLRTCKLGSISADKLNMISIDPGNTGMSIYDGPITVDENKHVRDMLEGLSTVITALDSVYGFTIIDIESGLTAVSQLAIESCDVIIVCLPHNKIKCKNFLLDYKDKIDFSKCCLLITQYDTQSSFTLMSVKSMFKSLVHPSRCLSIVYTRHISHAVNTSSMKSVIYKYSDKRYAPSEDMKSYLDDLAQLYRTIQKSKGGVQ